MNTGSLLHSPPSWPLCCPPTYICRHSKVYLKEKEGDRGQTTPCIESRTVKQKRKCTRDHFPFGFHTKGVALSLLTLVSSPISPCSDRLQGAGFHLSNKATAPLVGRSLNSQFNHPGIGKGQESIRLQIPGGSAKKGLFLVDLDMYFLSLSPSFSSVGENTLLVLI
jgi:hypothetical protein